MNTTTLNPPLTPLFYQSNRKRLITWLFNHSQQFYTTWFKTSPPWGITRDDLIRYPDGSLGKELGLFLQYHNFQLIPKVERHDIFHLLTGYGTAVEDEIALQYLCLANGKRSLYLLGAIALGTLILPEYLNYYLQSYRVGKITPPFHHHDYAELLLEDFLPIKEKVSGDGETMRAENAADLSVIKS